MFQIFLTLLARFGLTRLSWVLLFAVPLWCVRITLPAGFGEIIEAAQGGPLTTDSVAGYELSALGFLLFVGSACLAHACLAAPALGALGRRTYRRREVAAVMLPAAGLACCHFVWQWLLVGILAIVGFSTGLFGAEVATLGAFLGLAILLQHAASTLLSQLGEFLKRRGPEGEAPSAPLSRGAYRRWEAFVLTPMAGLYVLVSGLVEMFVEMNALGELGTGAVFALTALLEALVLVAWLTANVVVWHRYRGHAPLAEDVAGVFT